MISESTILVIFGGLTTIALAFLKLETSRLKTRLKNLCKDCVYDFTPKTKNED